MPIMVFLSSRKLLAGVCLIAGKSYHRLYQFESRFDGGTLGNFATLELLGSGWSMFSFVVEGVELLGGASVV